MPARLTAYLPDHPATSCVLRSEHRIRIGRGADCEFPIEHRSVSREHAELSWRDARWHLQDLGSKNGSFVDSVRTAAAVLDDHVWLRFGDILCEFVALSNEAADQAEHRLAVRHANSLILVEGLAQQSALPDLLHETVRATVELADCERGFLLLNRQGTLEVVASHGLDLTTLGDREFRGSIGAVQRALAGQVAVVINDISSDSDLAGRASVITGGLRALVCLPLLADGEPLGLIYADSRVIGTIITTMDLELLRAFAERAALWITARRAMDALTELAPSARLGWSDILDVQRLMSA